MGSINTMEVMFFQKTIAPSENDYVKQRVKANGTVEQLRVRFYPGQQLSLRVNVIVMHKGNRSEPLVSYLEGGNQFLSGEDDYFVLPVVVPVEYDDEIRVYFENTDGSNPYTLSVQVVVDYFAGTDRVVGGVANG
jgi:hypothetical protein